jgi:hypothetical protein
MALVQRCSAIHHLASLIHRLGDRFVRRRVWSPTAVAIGLLLLKQAGRRRSYSTMLRMMRDDFAETLGWKRMPTVASFVQARSKLSEQHCRDLLSAVVAQVDAAAGSRFTHPSGRRLVAIDSSRMVMPRTASTVQRFPRPGVRSDLRAHNPQALAVFAVDVMKRLPLDWIMLSKGHGEREGAIHLAQDLRPGDIVIVDRGFPARTFLGNLLDRRLDVVVRMTTSEANAWPEVLTFLESGQEECAVDVRVADDRSVRMRLIRRNFRPGRPRAHQKAQTMVVLTTILDAERFPRADILHIYTARWGVETLLRELKAQCEVERFHTRSRTGFEQEIAMSLLWIALTSALQHVAESTLLDGRHVARTHCAFAAERMIDRALAGKDPFANLEEDLAWLRKGATKPRPGRSYPRHRKYPFGRYNNDSAK